MLLLVSSGIGQVRAQAFDSQTEGIVAGRFVLHPSMAVEYTQNSNVFYRSEDLGSSELISSGVVVIRPRILVDLPLGESRIRWAYSPLYRDYTSDRFRQSDKYSHFFDLEALFKSSRGITIGLRDHFVRGTVELQQIDRGGELTFGLVPFNLHEPSLELGIDLGARQGITIFPRFSSVRFDNPDEASFFDYRKSQIETRYNYKLTPATTLYAFHTWDRTTQGREIIFVGDVGVNSGITGLGLARTLNQAVVTSISAGYETMVFERSTGRNFAGPTLDASITWLLSDVTRLDVTARRQAYQSFFINNNYYANSQLGAKIVRQVGRSAYLSLGATYQRSAYSDPVDISVTPETPAGMDANGNGLIDAFESFTPSQGLRRRDGTVLLEAGVGFQLRPTLRAFIGYNFDRRTTNVEEQVEGAIVDPLDYQVNRLTFRIEAGWL